MTRGAFARLTDVEVRKAKSTEKPQNISGSHDLVFPVTPQGNKFGGWTLHTGEEMSVHGFRGMAAIRLNKLAYHPRRRWTSEQSSIRAAYNRAQYLPERVKML